MMGTYYIHKLESNSLNLNEYVYLDYIDGKLSIQDGKWFLDLNLYLINNFILPINSFYLNVETPSLEIQNIKLNEINNVYIPDCVNNKDDCKVYNAKFYISTIDDPFFEQKLTNYLYEITFSFSIDSNVFNNNQIDANQNEIDCFINELEEILMSTKFEYTNYYSFADNASAEHIYEYELSSNENGIKHYQRLEFYTNNYINKKDPIKELLEIKSNSQFDILSKKITFYYSIEQEEIKTLEYVDNNCSKIENNCNLNYLLKTKFDEEKNEIVNAFDGIDGFFSPKATIGYYQVSLLISINGSKIEYHLSNNFSFDTSIKNKNSKINEIFIKETSWMKKVTFNVQK